MVQISQAILRRRRFVSTRTWLLVAGGAIAVHTIFTMILQLRLFPRPSWPLEKSHEGSPLHVITAYPRVPVMPNVLLIGARGAGTDLVSKWLVSSGACRGEFPKDGEWNFNENEVHFFDNDDLYKLGVKFYSNLFKHCEEKNKTSFILDATPETLMHPQRVYNVYSQLGQAPGGLANSLKLIVILREPVSKEFYLYSHRSETENDGNSFEEYSETVLKIRILEAHKLSSPTNLSYADQLTPWMTYFKREQLLVLSYDELEYNRLAFMWRVEQYVGSTLNRDFVADEERDTMARKIPARALDMLDPLYWGKNQELYHFLQKQPGPKMEQHPFPPFENAKSTDVVLPNVLLLGAQFSGVALIADFLIKNRVCNPAIFNNDIPSMWKNVRFFDQSSRYQQGIEFYARRYKHCQIENRMELILDGTPNYLTYPQLVYDIYSQAPGDIMARLKLVMVLREPISRELLQYQQKVFDYHHAKDKKNGWYMDVVDQKGAVMTFDQYSESVLKERLNGKSSFANEGKYVDHLKQWFQLFPRHQFLILSFDELRKDPKKVQWRVEKFLGYKFEIGELGKVTEIVNVPQRAKEILGPLFDKKNEELYEFLKSHTGPYMEENPFPKFIV
ncbi:hypothetical protein ACHAWX_004410 [Stephanocyclus meneghinianus]